MDARVDGSWLVVFGLGAWTLVTIGPGILPSNPPGEIAVLAVLGALGLLAALALHEIARSAAARACGVPVRRVTLFLFGGITDLEGAAPSPRVEATASAVALLANAVAGAALLAVASLSGAELERGAPGIVLLEWLGIANAVVALVNLLPAYPLDGGRIVRALVWRATHDLERATRWSAWSAEVLGWSAMAVGVALVLATSRTGMVIGMWTTIGGWYLASAGAQAYEGFTKQWRSALEY